MNELTICFIRHGWTEYNHKGIFCSEIAPPLSVYGVRDLANLCKEFPYDPVDKVYCSPLLRCQMTAAIAYPSQTPTIIPDLKEMVFGEYDGRLAQEVHQEPYYQQKDQLGDAFRMPGGESFAEVAARMSAAMHSIIEDAATHQLQHIAVVSHSIAISSFLKASLDAPLTKEQLFLPNGMGHLVKLNTSKLPLQKGYLHYISPVPLGCKRPDMAQSPYMKHN